MLNLAKFSDTVLSLHGLAHDTVVDRFQEKALSTLQDVLPFDAAWWGIMSSEQDRLVLHCSVTYGLPGTYVDMWEDCKNDDSVALAVKQTPNTTVHFDAPKLASLPGLYRLTAEHDIGQALCTSIYLPSEQSFVYLSLYRSFRSRAFDAEHRLLNQQLMPHLYSAWTTNRAFQLEHLKTSLLNRQPAVAIVDRRCEVLNAESRFFEVLSMECPDFKTYTLPNIFSAWLQAPEETLHLSRIVAKKYCFGDLRLVALRERTRVDLLSQRELQIGRDFGRGLSYQQIAKDRQISPATVRHHLRAIYLKLGVTDKAELTSLMDESEPLLDVNALIERYRLLASKHFS